jgi:hypothetical protein
MNPHLQFWNQEFRVDRSLEVDSWGHRLLNRYIVSNLMNAFPKTATRVFSRSKGELARLIFVEREGGSFLVLRAVYQHEDPRKRGDVLNRLLMQSPAVKAARNRRIIAEQMLFQALKSLPSDVPSLILAIGGGDGSFEVEAMARAGNPNVYLCIVDTDKRTVGEHEIALAKNNLTGKGVVFVGTAAVRSDLEEVIDKSGRHFGIRFDGLGITVCHGIVEYLDIGVEGNAVFSELLRAIYGCTRKEGMLLLSQTDHHDRVPFFTRGLSLYMRLRDQDEITAEVEKAGWKIAVCEPEPMKLITMCSAVKTDREHLRIDSPSQIREPWKPQASARPARRERIVGRR